ncbi:MAG: hypothetical protein Q8O67_34270 [Deltaproteobacteria bacterium]|nr:hypothetical protein [Deltaproteobacteria bacterium]
MRSSSESFGEKTESPRGYSLIGVMFIGLIVAAGAAAIVVSSRESTAGSVLDSRSADAYTVALAGLTWAQASLDGGAGGTALAAAAAGSPQPVGGLTIHPFLASDQFAGVLTPPPSEGVSNADWVAFGRGHFGVTGAPEPLAPNGFVVRVIGQVGDAQVVLETNIRINILRQMPAGLTGCFSGDVQITFYDQESPYDYLGNMRFDGNGGVPLGMSADHDRLNGLARFATTAPVVPTVVSAPPLGYPVGRRWRGTQSLRGEPLALGVENAFGGLAPPAAGTNFVDDNVGPLAGWTGNPQIANDPRLVDDSTASGSGLGLNAGGRVNGVSSGTIAQMRGLPIIAFIGTPGDSPGTFPAEQATDANSAFFHADVNWAPKAKDDEARKGFYACDNHSGENSSLNHAVDVCTKGTTSGAGTALPVAAGTAPNWTASGLNHSGRAFGFVSSIMRQCTGSGDSINPLTGDPWFDVTNNPNGVQCANAFRWLENLGACLVMPVSTRATTSRGTNANRPAGNGLSDDFKGCHPGCLIAVDADGDGASDHPYRSACINLDPNTVTTYGPGVHAASAAPVVTADPTNPYTTDNDGDTVLDWQQWNNAHGSVTPATRDFADAIGNRRVQGGFVAERGNPSLITRMDMTDRGPLGTCQQNCIGYGFGRDSTYGAHRGDIASPGGVIGTTAKPEACTAAVPKDPSGFTTVHCNLDYDLDGRLDRKTYAISSSYREECADPHDGIAWAPAFNISTDNSNITGAGCPNTLPNFTGSTPPPLSAFCNQGQLAGIQQSVAQISAGAATLGSSVTVGAVGEVGGLLKKGGLIDGANWFGGARCHMGGAIATYVGKPDPGLHPHTGALAGLPNTDVDVHGHNDFWIEEECDEQKVIIVDSAITLQTTLNVGQVCGCGVLIVRDTVLKFAADSHLLWRGLVVWEVTKAPAGDLLQSSTGPASFIVEGGTLMTGNQDFTIKITRKDADITAVQNNDAANLKLSFRQNPQAMTDAFGVVGSAIKGVRRLR